MKGEIIPQEVNDYLDELRREVCSLRTFRQTAWSRAIIDLQFWAIREGMSLGTWKNFTPFLKDRDAPSDHPYPDRYYMSVKSKEATQKFTWQKSAYAEEDAAPRNFEGTDVLYERYLSGQRPRRVHCRCPVRFKSLEGETSTVGWVKNLSVGGIFIQSDQGAPPLGSMIALGFVLEYEEGRHLIKTMGQIAWVQDEPGDGPPGFGLKFVEPSSGMVEAIEQVVFEQLPVSGPL